jgi:hypothetical protein
VTVKAVTATAPAPTVSLTASDNTITAGDASTLTWSSKNAAACTASGAWTGSKAVSGTLSVKPTATTTYTLTCTSAGGSAVSSAKITVSAAATPAPVVKLTASPTSITAGGSSTLTWTSSNSDSCTASGSWSGAKDDSDTASVSPTATATYTLSCSGAGGTTKASATVSVTAVAANPPTTTPASGTSWVYYNGSFDWPGDYSFVATPNYSDTTGSPLSGTKDIKMTTTSAYGGWLPYAQNWAFNSAPYTKLTFALKPTKSGQNWVVYFVKVGDVPVGIELDVTKYGPTPVAGQWGVYTVPLKDLGVLGTVIYKFCIQDQLGQDSNTWYVDNVGFVP